MRSSVFIWIIHQLEEPLTLHLAQALCYAYMYCADHENINSITIQITYCNLETEEIRRPEAG